MKLTARYSLTLLIATTAVVTAACAQTKFANWYPSSISPPAGHTYPCALTALPADLTGIPAQDRRFINHVYSMLLKALHAKLVMIDCVLASNQSLDSAYSAYYRDTVAARQKIMAEPVPAGLGEFRNSVVKAIDTQIQFFGKAVSQRKAGGSAQAALAIPEGKTASQLLLAAWSQMQARYPQMSPAVKDSTYHHLCALDVF